MTEAWMKNDNDTRPIFDTLQQLKCIATELSDKYIHWGVAA
jgi:hypothetical protein